MVIDLSCERFNARKRLKFWHSRSLPLRSANLWRVNLVNLSWCACLFNIVERYWGGAQHIRGSSVANRFNICINFYFHEI